MCICSWRRRAPEEVTCPLQVQDQVMQIIPWKSLLSIRLKMPICTFLKSIQLRFFSYHWFDSRPRERCPPHQLLSDAWRERETDADQTQELSKSRDPWVQHRLQTKEETSNFRRDHQGKANGYLQISCQTRENPQIPVDDPMLRWLPAHHWKQHNVSIHYQRIH